MTLAILTFVESEHICEQKVVTVLDLFNVYAMVLEEDESASVDLARAKIFGQYLATLSTIEREWLQIYGAN